MKDKCKKITKDIFLLDLVEKYPELIETLTLKYGLHCIGCGAAASETLEEGAMVHGMTAKEIKEMVGDLNRELEEN
jgi:hybrid cluster-associated redox disulfide protein